MTLRVLVSYRAIPQSPHWSTGDFVVKALRELGHEVNAYAKYYQQNRWVEDPKELLTKDYDLFLFLECNDGDSQYLELNNIKAKKRCSWTFDNSYYPDGMRGLLGYFNFNYHFLANPLFLNKFPNSYYLPYACDSELHYRPLDFPKTRDVALVGTIRQDRIDLKNALKAKGIELELISGVFREQYIDTLASARVVINQNPIQGRGLFNMRFWEAQAAGSILLTEEEDLKINYDAGWRGEGVIGYQSINELPALCRAFLHKNKNISQENVLQKHTYKNRCEEILNVVN